MAKIVAATLRHASAGLALTLVAPALIACNDGSAASAQLRRSCARRLCGRNSDKRR